MNCEQILEVSWSLTVSSKHTDTFPGSRLFTFRRDEQAHMVLWVNHVFFSSSSFVVWWDHWEKNTYVHSVDCTCLLDCAWLKNVMLQLVGHTGSNVELVGNLIVLYYHLSWARLWASGPCRRFCGTWNCVTNNACVIIGSNLLTKNKISWFTKFWKKNKGSNIHWLSVWQ